MTRRSELDPPTTSLWSQWSIGVGFAGAGIAGLVAGVFGARPAGDALMLFVFFSPFITCFVTCATMAETVGAFHGSNEFDRVSVACLVVVLLVLAFAVLFVRFGDQLYAQTLLALGLYICYVCWDTFIKTQEQTHIEELRCLQKSATGSEKWQAIESAIERCKGAIQSTDFATNAINLPSILGFLLLLLVCLVRNLSENFQDVHRLTQQLTDAELVAGLHGSSQAKLAVSQYGADMFLSGALALHLILAAMGYGFQTRAPRWLRKILRQEEPGGVSVPGRDPIA